MNKLIIIPFVAAISSCSMYEQKQSCHKWYDYSGPVAASLGALYLSKDITTADGKESKDTVVDSIPVDNTTNIGPETPHPKAMIAIDLIALGSIWIHGGEGFMPSRDDSECIE